MGWGGVRQGSARWRCWGRGREHYTVPDQLVVDKELEFRVEVGETDTEGGPVVGREHREEVVDRRTVSTTHKHATDQVKGVTQTWVWKQTTHTYTHNVRGGKTLKTQETWREKTSREKGREKSHMSKCGFIAPKVSVCQVSVRK